VWVGLTALVQVVMAAMIAPRERGRYSGYLGATFALATISGPLLGGLIVDTSWLGWRWCFFVGAPFALLAFIVLQKTLHLPVVRREGVSIDYLGATLIVGGVSTLLIWVSLAGHQFAWGSPETALMVGGGVLLLALAVWRRHEPPSRSSRSGCSRPQHRAGTFASLFVGVTLFAGTVFLSQYFQISRGKSPTVAGLMSLPMIAGLVLAQSGGSGASSPGPVATSAGWSPAAHSSPADCCSSAPSTRTRRCGSSASGWPSSVSVSARPCRTSSRRAEHRRPGRLGAASSTVSFFRSLGGAIGVSALGALLGHQVTSLVASGLTRLGVAPSADGASGGIPDVAALPARCARWWRTRTGWPRRTSSW
jgi:hypothetical protein